MKSRLLKPENPSFFLKEFRTLEHYSFSYFDVAPGKDSLFLKAVYKVGEKNSFIEWCNRLEKKEKKKECQENNMLHGRYKSLEGISL